MTQNAVTSPTSPNLARARAAWPGRTSPDHPTPPTGGGGRGEVASGAPEDGARDHLSGRGSTDFPCARCPSPILAGCPRISEVVFAGVGMQITSIAGVVEYHPGCWAAELAEGARS